MTRDATDVIDEIDTPDAIYKRDAANCNALILYNSYFIYLRKHDRNFQLFLRDLRQLLKIYRKIPTPKDVHSLPLEVWNNIIDFYDARALCVTSQVSRLFRNLSNDMSHWDQLLAKDFYISSREVSGNTSSKELYHRSYSVKKNLFNSLSPSVPAPSTIPSNFLRMLRTATPVH